MGWDFLADLAEEWVAHHSVRRQLILELAALLQLLQRILDAPCELFVALQEAQESRPRDAPAKAFLEARWRGGGPG